MKKIIKFIAVAFFCGLIFPLTFGLMACKKDDSPPSRAVDDKFAYIMLTTGKYSIKANRDGNLMGPITIPSTFRGIEITQFAENAFKDCSRVYSFAIPETITKIRENTFKNCTGLHVVNIPSSIVEIGHEAFSGCSALTEISIPASVTTIGYDAFLNCSSITTIRYGGSEEQWNNVDKQNGWNSFLGDGVSVAGRYYVIFEN